MTVVRGILVGGCAVLCATAAWIALQTDPAPGYELSIYDGIPPLFWVLTCFASVVAAVTLLFEVDEPPSAVTWVACIVIAATNALLIALPAIRGYAVSDRADPLTHIGFARDLSRTGQLPSDDFYPALHILQVLGTDGIGLDPGQSLVAISVVFTITWTAGISILAAELSRDSRTYAVGVALASPLALVTYNALPLPSTLSAMVVPLAIGLHLRRGRNLPEERVPLILAEIGVAVAVVLLHPVTALYLLILLGAVELTGIVLNWVGVRPETQGAPAYWPHTRGMLGILAAVLAAWTTSFAILIHNAAAVVQWLLGESTRASALSESLGLLDAGAIAPLKLAKAAFNAVGLPVIVSMVATAIAATVVIHSLRQRRWPSTPNVVLLSLLGSAIAMAAVLFVVSSSERYPVRLLRIIVLLGLAAIAWKLSNALLLRPRFRRLGLLVPSCVVLTLAIVLGQMNVFPHPRNALPNMQVMDSDLAAADWLLAHRGREARQASSIPSYVSRLNTALSGSDGIRAELPRWWEADLWLPTHILDPSWACAADVSDRATHFVLPQSAAIAPLRFPPELRSLARQYTPDDVAMLRNDASISKVYDNGHVEIWTTQPGTCR